MKVMNKFIYTLILLSVYINIQNGQTILIDSNVVYNDYAEKCFLTGLKFFQDGKYDTAASVFVRTIKDFPRNQRTTSAFIMGAKALYETGRYQESIRLLKDLIDLYPFSNYIDDAHYTLGMSYLKLNRYEDAALQFISAIQLSNEPKLITRANKLLEMLAESNLEIKELQFIQVGVKNIEIRTLLDVAVAKKMLKAGDITSAVQILRQVINLPPNIKYVNEAISLLKKIEKQTNIKIGILLPLMLKAENPATRELGLEFFRGIKLAIDEHNQISGMNITFDLRDTEKDPSVAARQIASLCNDDSVGIIIGPILSNEVFACAGIANERNVPLITPTATANGISAIGPFIFQANPDLNIRPRAIAAYAYNVLNARTFAVLSPADEISKQIANAFIEEVKMLGGDIIDVEYYSPITGDLRMEISKIRQRALERLEVPVIDFGGKMKQSELNKIIALGVKEKVLDSLIERRLSASVTFLFGERGKIIADSLKLSTKVQNVKYDSLGLPVNNIDAIFVPITSSDEIPVVSSQLKYFNIQAQILGTGDWYDISALDNNKQYTDGVIFTLDSYYDPKSEEYQSFVAKYKIANNKNPGDNALFGYDVARLVTKVIGEGNYRRTDIANALAKVEGFVGLHTKISLSLERVNSYLTVVQYKNRKIVRIGEIDLALLRKMQVEAPKGY